MVKIILQADSLDEAQEIMWEIYRSDPSAVFVKNKQYVHSSVLLAELQPDNKIMISSEYYTEKKLREMFDKEYPSSLNVEL